MATATHAHLPPLPKDEEKSPQLLSVENKFKAYILAMRIRSVDLFADFDKLRSGLVSHSQFRRGVGAAMDKGIVSPLTESEIDILQSYYSNPGSNAVRWRDFVASIDTVFQMKPTESSGKPFRRPLSPSSETILEEIIKRLKSYVKHHGSDVKSWFKDFDKYNNGYVTYNQFARGIPQNLLSMDEEELLVARYGEKVNGTVNYFKMNTDVNRKDPRPVKDASVLVAKHKQVDWYAEHVPVGTEELLHGGLGFDDDITLSLANIEEKIKKHVYKNRIRLMECFRDYDRHNCGLVTLAQFEAGLRLASLPLEDAELGYLVTAYQNDEGRLSYRTFCNSIDEVFTINDLEKNPLQEVSPPSRDWLMKGSNDLTAEEEEQCQTIIKRFRAIIHQRRPLLAPFFKDFDKHLGNIGRVTRSHFSRLLSMINLPITDDDLHLLFRKYEDRAQGKVNYMEFIHTIDSDTYKVPIQKQAAETDSRPTTSNSKEPTIEVQNLLNRIKNHVGSRRIRVSEFFRDFDKLRSSSIRKEEFLRCLSWIGVNLKEEESTVLANHYADPKKASNCRWKDFEANIESVFGESNLESRPTLMQPLKTEKQSPFVMARKALSRQEEEILQDTLQRIRDHLKLRQLTVKPFFRDFDKVCTGTGHVTKSQFRQCLTYMKCDVSQEEFEILCKRWTKSASGIEDQVEVEEGKRDYIKDVGENICYILFLEELQKGLESDDSPAPLPKPVTPEVVKSLVKNNMTLFDEEEFQKLMMRIKITAKTTRIRVIDFMADFDHLRHGRISKNEFRRALKVIYPDLTEENLQALELKYESKEDSSRVNYVAFSDEVESVFTNKGLVRDPTAKVIPFDVYSNGWEADPSVNVLNPEEEIILHRVLNRLADKVTARRIDALSYMEDYDFVKEGTITTNQFRSVLNSMGMYITDEEMRVFTKRFATNSSFTRINYRSLSTIST